MAKFVSKRLEGTCVQRAWMFGRTSVLTPKKPGKKRTISENNRFLAYNSPEIWYWFSDSHFFYRVDHLLYIASSYALRTNCKHLGCDISLRHTISKIELWNNTINFTAHLPKFQGPKMLHLSFLILSDIKFAFGDPRFPNIAEFVEYVTYFIKSRWADVKTFLCLYVCIEYFAFDMKISVGVYFLYSTTVAFLIVLS